MAPVRGTTTWTVETVEWIFLSFTAWTEVTSPEEGFIEDIWGIFDVLGHSDAAHRFVGSLAITGVW